ncbi:hypothetical protein N473_05760 [Pseudoalteromonas luteoviolacea CPMOR-1]|uniref:Glycosyltransferase subfamily 4-like N-terminal domain-containing protein n=1 Tax=Pseudoalteromonas luteoviolacea CPMOR-1 TaxID=1365248 RepID=A0A167HKW0_9GAMM|nr:glycosyltransferase [Pseudoalteromonas luteoviolacea]KZN58247.1 hypothetical protein N473_05760 [Pseudoalteromonas luteoviolacea CPMOR-1]
MKVVHVISALFQGGAERQLDLLISEFRDQNPEIEHVIVSLKSIRTPLWDEFERKGIKVISCDYSLVKLPQFLKKLHSVLSEFDPEHDVIQCWMYHAELLGGLTAKKLGFKKIFWNIRTTYLKSSAVMTKIVRQINAKLSYSIPSKIVCVAEASKNYHIECGYNESKMTVIENGFVPPNIKTERSLLREQLGVDSDTVLIGSVGRYSSDKAQDLFVSSAALIDPKYRVKFVLVGRGNNRENKELAENITRQGLDGIFVLQDETRDVASFMNAMDIFCLHSRSEGFPNVLGEAMYAGLPCTTTNVGDALKLVGETAIVCADTSPQSIADALNKLLLQSESERQALGASAKKRVVNHFSIQSAQKKYFQLYSQSY